MNYWKFKGLLQNDGWLKNVFVGLNSAGEVEYLSPTKPDGATSIETVNGYAMPGYQNAHSHAFQFAMAGIAERHEGSDDFWSWREAMYKLALSMDPEQMEDIASMLYAEMLRHGYTSVAEFHYVHHDKNGKAYNNLAETGERMVAAARKAGIKITLVPIFYQKGGFGREPGAGQRRFISADKDAYLKLFESSNNIVKNNLNAAIGIGIHSLRGVEPSIIDGTLADLPKNIPVHIHVSEQLKEIEDSLAYLGKRPVEWVLDNLNPDNRFQLVHATHLMDFEVERLAKSHAQVVICPSTEGNLGDGLFSLLNFQKHGGRWCIGTDSHIGLNPEEELRLLDYGQRLTTHRRNIYHSKEEKDSGTYAINKITSAGRIAMGNNNDKYFSLGQPFDAVIKDANNPLIAMSSDKNLLSTILYSTDCSANLGTIVNGRWVVKNNEHQAGQQIATAFNKTIKKLNYR